MALHMPSRMTGLATFVLLLSSTAVHADADGPDYFRVTGVRANDVLHLRAAPTAKAKVLEAIPHDANGIRNLGCRGGQNFAEWQRSSPEQRRIAANRRWCQIEYRGIKGWAAGRFLAEGRSMR